LHLQRDSGTKKLENYEALVTGTSGFIGSTLIEELNTLGFEVRVLIRQPGARAFHLEGLQYDGVEGDFSNFQSLRRAVKDVNYIFHLDGTPFDHCRAESSEKSFKTIERVAQR
jgi:nucleoside-diphosphate-sugar epimerase